MAAPAAKPKVQYKEPFSAKLRGDLFGNMASYRTHPHRGMDWHPAELSPIPAAAAGKVTQVFWSNVLGWVVEVLHADGVYLQYCHIAPHTVAVDAGAVIKLGQIIGKTGGGKKTPSGSASTGSHLHMGASRVKNGHLADYSKLLDPLKWILANLTAVAAEAPATTPAPAIPTVPAVEAAPAPAISSAEDLAAAVAAPVAAPATTDLHAEDLKIDLTKKPKIGPGSKNAYVTYVQLKLGQSPTGVYDDKLKKAVIALQKKNSYVADGVFGPRTWDRIIEL